MTEVEVKENKITDPISDLSPYGGTTSYATLVSMLPIELIETKPGLIPGQFKIPKADKGDFSILIITDSFHYIYLDSDRGSVPSIDPALKVAQSIVYDYVTNILMRDDQSMPGLFCIPGRLSKEEIVKRYSVELTEFRLRQNKWFNKLVALADDHWAMNRKRKNISDMSRHAAIALNLNREWITVIEDKDNSIAVISQECPACLSPVRDGAIICAVCRTILNKEKWEALQKA